MARSRSLSTRLGAVEQHEAAIPSKPAVHEMRVAVRRLRAALRVMRLRALEPPVKRLQDALGDVRDLQLQIDWLRGRDERLRRSLQTRLQKAEQHLALELRRWRSEGLPALLEVAGASAGSARKVHKLLRKRLQRLEERLERARQHPTPTFFHRARIAVKQVRYLLDEAKKSLPKQTIRLASDLKTLQATLGELHDVDVRMGLVSRKPSLLRDQQEARSRLVKIANAQLTRWHDQKLVPRASSPLR